MLIEIKTLVDILQKLFGLRADERARIVGLLEQMAHELDQLSATWTRIMLHLQSNRRPFSNGISHDLFAQTSHFEALKRFLRERENNKIFTPLNTSAAREFFQTVQGALDAKGELYGLVHDILYPGEPWAEAIRTTIRKTSNHSLVDSLGPVPYLFALLDDEALLEREKARLLEKETRDIIDLFPAGGAVEENDIRYLRFKERAFEERLMGVQELSTDRLRKWAGKLLAKEQIPEKVQVMLEDVAEHVRVELERRKREEDGLLQMEALQSFRLRVAQLVALAGDFRAQVALYKAGLTR